MIINYFSAIFLASINLDIPDIYLIFSYKQIISHPYLFSVTLVSDDYPVPHRSYCW